MGQAKGDLELIENLEQILSTLRHELGNSINSLKITLDVLQKNYDSFDDIKRKNYLSRVSELVSRQQRMIEAMKSYSNLIVEDQENIKFPIFWEHFVNIAALKLKNDNIRLIHYLEVEPCLIKANGVAINQIMINILDNAIEAVKEKKDAKIEVKAVKDNGYVLILLKDNGSGINNKDAQKIFIPLFTTKQGKMGMGLPITRRLLFNMGGRIEIESRRGSGTEARVWLKTVSDQ